MAIFLCVSSADGSYLSKCSAAEVGVGQLCCTSDIFRPFGSKSDEKHVTKKNAFPLKPNSITLASSELAPNMFGASSELASVMEFGFYGCMAMAIQRI